jgi:hypothetical protein
MTIFLKNLPHVINTSGRYADVAQIDKGLKAIILLVSYFTLIYRCSNGYMTIDV